MSERMTEVVIGRLGRRCPVRAQSGVTLIELLISMTVLAVITTMIITVWIGLQSSFAQSSKASWAREAARDGVTRMTEEIRDAQASGTGNAITEAGPSRIVFYSTYNLAGNNVTGSDPRQTAFVYQQTGASSSGTIYRVVDTTGDGTLTQELAYPSTYGRPIVENVVNTETSTDIFRYSFYDADGIYRTVSPMTQSTALVRAVQIRVHVDLNPGHSPTYIDLKTTAQPRNMRPST
jgi:prepilin-type N-terminal cleavage/methylation domain-containing protein